MPDPAPPFAHTVRRAQRGDLDAFTELVRRFQDMAVGYAWSVLGDFHLAEDAAQDAFVQVLSDLPGLRAPAAFPGWLKRILFKHCDRRTRGTRLATSPLDGMEETMADRRAPDALDRLQADQSAQLVHRALATLPEHQREAVTLFYMGQRSQSEVAAFLDISEGAVRKRLFDARKALKAQMIDMVEQTLHDDAPSRDDRFEKRVLRSALPLQVAVVDDGGERDLGSTVAGREVDLPAGDVWFVEPRIDVGDDDEAFERLLDEMKARRIPGLRTGGRLSDRHLPRLAELADHLVYLDISGGNTGITDDGLRHLAQLPRLRHLNLCLNGGFNSPTLVPARVTDAGLGFLSELHDLESLGLDFLFGVGDAALDHVRSMPRLRHLGLRGTLTTDAGLANLDGLAQLASLDPGPLTTDAGLAVLRDLPAFVDSDRPRARLGLLNCPFIGDAGLETLADLPGLDFLWLCESRLLRDRWVGFLDAELPWVAGYTGAGLAPLAGLPHLREIVVSGDRQDDDALEHLGRFPALTELGCALPVAGDHGWCGLARSRSLWRVGAFEAPNLTGAGVAALATMPQLRDLGIGGPQVHDDDLAPLTDMESLRAFTAARGNVFTDAAYAHLGRVQSLERLSTGRARTIGDAATEHIVGLRNLRSLELSGWKMTDRTCQLLAEAPALEDLSLRVRRLTDAGLPHLNRCKSLKNLQMDDCPLITEAGVGALRGNIDLDWQPATVRNLIEAVIEDETVREQAVTALAGRGEAARHEVTVFLDLVPDDLRPVLQGILDRM